MLDVAAEGGYGVPAIVCVGTPHSYRNSYPQLLPLPSLAPLPTVQPRRHPSHHPRRRKQALPRHDPSLPMGTDLCL